MKSAVILLLVTLAISIGHVAAEDSTHIKVPDGRAGSPLPAADMTGSGPLRTAAPTVLFQAGTLAYNSSQFGPAANAFREAAKTEPSSGALLNLGLAAWQQAEPGVAVWAWEQAVWIDSFNRHATQNLRFARKAAQLEAPELAWYEVVSTWLPVNWWAWIAAGAFWTAIGATFLPGMFRRSNWSAPTLSRSHGQTSGAAPRRAGFQALAAFSLTVFLLTVPALFGVQSRSHIGIILQKECPLRLTPTAQAQNVTRLAAGEALRVQRVRGEFCLVKNSRLSGWVRRAEIGLITQQL